MKQIYLLTIILILAISFASCGNNDSRHNDEKETIGENIGLVLLWSFDGDNITQGTAPFNLYDNNGTYYVDFYGEMCKLRSIPHIPIDNTELCYSFTSSKVGQYTYYLEDISQYSNRFFNND